METFARYRQVSEPDARVNKVTYRKVDLGFSFDGNGTKDCLTVFVGLRFRQDATIPEQQDGKIYQRLVAGIECFAGLFVEQEGKLRFVTRLNLDLKSNMIGFCTVGCECNCE